MTTLSIPARFNGPADSGNGGVTCGLLATQFPVGATVQVTLRRPPPLDTALRVEADPTTARAFAGADLVADAVVVEDDAIGAAVPAVDPRTARVAMASYEGLSEHPFPTCFVCGPARPDADGLDLFPGPVADREATVATTYLPKGSHFPPDFPAGVVLAWAALDCPGGWAIGLPGRPAVLGRMTARVLRVPQPDEACVVVGQLDEWSGRKAFSRVSLYGPDGTEYARARQTWIELR